MIKNQIIELWKSIGWNTLTDYYDHLKSDSHIILDELDPDKINPKCFWSAADEHFGTDPVCNQSIINDRVLDIPEVNHQNSLLPHYLGMNGQTEMVCDFLNKTFGKINMAEIGCGYNAIHNLYKHIENKYWNKTSYTGFDIIKRVSDIIEIEGEDGTLSDEQVKKYTEAFNLFYSSNTFQHLSKKQIEKYLRDIYAMLPFGGYFNVMYVDDCNETYHYGQTIKMFHKNELIDLAISIGYVIMGSSTIKMDNSLTPFSLLLKK
jgi:hypothetical protein